VAYHDTHSHHALTGRHLHPSYHMVGCWGCMCVRVAGTQVTTTAPAHGLMPRSPQLHTQVPGP
jgi:hypothetical protein